MLNSQSGLQRKSEEVAKLEEMVKEKEQSPYCLVEKIGAHYATWIADHRSHATDSAELSRRRSKLETAQRRLHDSESVNSKLRADLDERANQLRKCEEPGPFLENRCQRRDLKLKDKTVELQNCRDTLTTVNENLGIEPMDEQKTLVLPRRFDI